jgi:hypothetical protein
MSYNRGRLLASDEQFVHQTVDTLATVSESDLSWTEKVWASVFRADGGVQIDVGLGKYTNRNVMDAFAGISRGTEQWTVRSSRELSQDLETTAVSPINYEVVEPLESVRFWLDANDAVPIAFDITLTGLTPPFFEERDRRWDRTGTRIVTDLLRYHQPITATGWVEVDGERETIDGGWFGFRDHSWGIRRNVGADAPDIRKPSRALQDTDYRMHWSPMVFRKPDGEWYELMYHLQDTSRSAIYSSGHLNQADGSQVEAWRIRPDVTFDQTTRRLIGGTIAIDLKNGEQRVIEIEPMSDTGFHLGTGLYMEFEGKHHGAYMGKHHVEGEHIADCADPDTVRRVHQLRDCIVRVREGEAEGWGVFESIMTGGWPDSGLTADGSFV